MTTQAGLYYRLRTAAVRALRRIPGVRAAAHAVMADELARLRKRRGMAGPPLDIRPGRFFADGKGRTLPVVVFVSIGLGPGDGERIAAAVERVQYIDGSFRPLFVLDDGQFGPFRTRGFAVEHVLKRETYAQVNPGESYGEYLSGRIGSIVASYRASSVVPLRPDALPDSALLRLAVTR